MYSYPDSYEQARGTFRQCLARIRERWPGARLEAHRLAGEEDLTIDRISADSTGPRAKLLIFTTGEHGIEGYVGTAVLRLFVEEFLDRLNPGNTGLLIVHPINPWGMAHRRRTNRGNVDLNRSFFREAQGAELRERLRLVNPGYERLAHLLNPQGPVPGPLLSRAAFLAASLRALVSPGFGLVRAATLLGQYRNPRGVYYGGAPLPEETGLLTGLFREHLGRYAHVLHLDIHTGYGPRDRMSLVCSPREPRESAELARLFRYPRVVKAVPSEFYTMSGDMIDAEYEIAQVEFPGKRLYAASLEFGTAGTSIAALVRSLRAVVLENQLHWFGTGSPAARAFVEHEFREMYAPSDAAWQSKAFADARQAFEGVLRAEGFVGGQGI